MESVYRLSIIFFAGITLNRRIYAIVFASAVFLLSGCGGGGGGDAPGQLPTSNPGTSAVTPSPVLGLVFSQGGRQLSYTEEAGIKTVKLNNAAFQILIPEQTFSTIFIRLAPDISSIFLAGNVMAYDPAISSAAGWRLAAVPEGDISVNGIKYEVTIAGGAMRTFNVRDIYRRFGDKEPSGVLYMRVYLYEAPKSPTQETIKIILN